MEAIDIKNLESIKNLDIYDLKNLCNDIRGYIISNVSENGGYLSSNLSSVEISVALAKCFNENDTILYNGPEINYTNRIINGLKMINNDYNNAIINAYGLSTSKKIQHNNSSVVAVVNSESVLSGNNIETLNQIGEDKRNMIIVFNDDTSIDKGIGIVDKFVSDLRRTKTYNNLKDNVKDFIRPQKGGEKIIEGIHNLKSSIKKSVIDEGIFNEFKIDYIGPVDGHNLKELISAFEIAKSKEYPCVVHCITTKGKGYVYAESNTNEAFVKTGAFDIKTGKKFIEESNDYINCTKVVSEYLLKLMQDNKDIVLISSGNKNSANLNHIFAKYPERCFDIPSSSSNALGFACGFSLDNRIPFVCLNSSKLSDGYSELLKQIDKLDKTLIIGLVADDDSDIQILNSLQNCIIATSNCDNRIFNLIDLALTESKPFIIRYTNTYIRCKNNKENCNISIGKWHNFANNKIGDTVIISDSYDCISINEIIKKNKYPYTLIDACFINPIDIDIMEKVFNKKRNVYVYSRLLEDKIRKTISNSKIKANVTFIDQKDIKKLFDLIEE